MCDRILCQIKASIRRYCNESHDAVSAKDIHTALKERLVRRTTASVCIVQEQNSTLEINKIANFSNLHNFEFTQGGCTWKVYTMELKLLFVHRKRRISWRRFHSSPLLLDELHQQEKAMMATTVVPINALNLVAMKILRPRPTLTSIWTS